MAEYTDYKLSMTDVEINNALLLVKSIETGSTKIIVPTGTTGVYTTDEIGLEKAHVTPPKIFLQLNRMSNLPSPFWTVQPIVGDVSETGFKVSLIATNTPVASDVKEIPSGTYYVDYFVIGI